MPAEKHDLITFLLSTVPMSGSVAEEIASHFVEQTFSKNDFILREGTVSNKYLFLAAGFMRAYTIDYEGNEITTGFYSKNEVVFEVSSFFTRSQSKENIQALVDCRAYVISFEGLNKLFHTIPDFRDFGRAMLVKGFVSLKQRTLALINETAEERYANLIHTQPDIFQYAQLKHIATYLGITDTSLSRIRREYQRK